MSAKSLVPLVCLVLVGCGQEVTPPAPGPSLTGDEQVMKTIDYLEPMYQVDFDKRVIKLRLSGRHLPPAVLAEVGKLSELRNLDCFHSTMNDEGLAQLKDLQNLRSMGVGNQITDKGLATLEKLPNLQWVWVPKHRVTKEGLDKLKEARPDMNVYPI